MAKVSEWVHKEESHTALSKFMSIERNNRMKTLDEMFTREPHVSYVKYSTEALKCKSMAQWKGRMLAVQIPEEAVHAVRTPAECCRLIALKYMSSVDVVPTADLKSRNYWVTTELTEWLA